MRLSDLKEEITSLFKEHPLSDLPTDILEMLLDYYNLNSYGMATQKMKQLTNSITAQLKQNGYTISHNGDILQVTKGRDRYVAHEEEIMEMLLNTLFKDGIDETTDDDLADRIRARQGSEEKWWKKYHSMPIIWGDPDSGFTKPTPRDMEPRRQFKYKEPFNPQFSHNKDKLDEGMGGSSGGGTPGSGGAGGSSLGLPYPSTYEEENDKFKYNSPVQRQMSLTTEDEQGEMFTDHDVMQLLMKDKGWPEDLQKEVLRKYANYPTEGENFIDSVEYEGTKKVDNYGLLQNTENMFILAGLPPTIIKTINETWGIRIKPSKYAKMSDLEFKKWINTPGYVSQPTVVIDSDVVLAEGKWIASVIRGEKSKLAHVLRPGAPKVKKNEPNKSLSPSGQQKELSFVENKEPIEITQSKKEDIINAWEYQQDVIKISHGMQILSGENHGYADNVALLIDKDFNIIDKDDNIEDLLDNNFGIILSEEDKLWARDELPQLNAKNFKNSEYTIKELKVSIDKLKPVQNERVRGLVKKTIKMLKSGKEKPIVVDKFGYIVNGHHRYDAYSKLGIKTVPVLKVNATIEELIDKYM